MRLLLADLRAGGCERRKGIAALYNEFAGRLQGYFMRHGATKAQAEDRLQEVFIRLLRSIEQFHGDETQLAPWLWTVARRVMVDAVRAANQVELDIEHVPDDAVSDERSSIQRDEAEWDEQALSACVCQGMQRFIAEHPGRAQCLSWLVSDSMTIAEIAGILGRNLGATREYLSQCRKKLRPYLEQCFTMIGSRDSRSCDHTERT